MEIYTDGACLKNGIGGCGFYTSRKEYRVLKYKETTNNRMEILAVINALEFFIKTGEKELVLYTDSMYCIYSLRRFYLKKKKTSRLKNPDLLKKLNSLLITIQEQNKKIKFEWVKGHSTNVMNNIIDLKVENLVLSSAEAVKDEIQTEEVSIPQLTLF